MTLVLIILVLFWAVLSYMFWFDLTVTEPYSAPSAPTTALFIGSYSLLTAVCFLAYVGMALRHGWSRLLTAAVFFLLFVLLVADLYPNGDFWSRLQTMDTAAHFIYEVARVSYIVPLFVLGVALVVSNKAKVYLSTRGPGLDQALPSPDPGEAEYKGDATPSRDLDEPT